MNGKLKMDPSVNNFFPCKWTDVKVNCEDTCIVLVLENRRRKLNSVFKFCNAHALIHSENRKIAIV
jgi:hypothetical protein